MKFHKINGMEFSRWIAAKLLQDSNLKNEKYYKKEDEYTDIIQQCLDKCTVETQEEFYEVQQMESSDKEEIIVCQTFETLFQACDEYYRLNNCGATVRILKVDKDGFPIEEIGSNY